MTDLIHIVDDDPSVRGATSFLLSSHGYATRLYASGSEFLQQADLSSGCVLLDLRMAGISGLQVLETLAASEADLPVILLTGHADVATAIEALRLGAADFLEKPYEEGELIAAIERVRAKQIGTRRDTGAKQAALARIERLSQREMQVLRGLLAGMTNKEMARRLDLSPRTVEMHRATMMADLEVDAAADAIRIAVDAELTPLDRDGEANAPTAAALAPQVGRKPRPATAAPTQPLDHILPPVLDVLEGSTDCAVLIDRHDHVTYLNRNAIETLTGGGDFLGHSLWELFPGAERTQLGESVRRAGEERTAASFEFFAPASSRWFDVSIRPIPSGLLLFLRDLTAERTATAALRQSDERLRLAVEASGDGTWDWTIRDNLVRISGRYAERLGYGSEELVLSTAEIWRMIHPIDREALKDRIEEHLDGSSDAFFCEYRIRSRDGNWYWNLDRGRVVARDPLSGAPLRMVVASTDVSSVKAMRQTLLEASERIKLQQESAGSGLWDLDVETLTLRLCERSREMLGFPACAPEQITIDEWKAVVHPDDLDRTIQSFHDAVETGRTFSARYRIVNRDGDIRWIRGYGKIAGREQERPLRMVGLNIDETEQAQSVEKLDRLQSDLVHVARSSAIGSMAAAIADELNQPLTAISNYVQGLKLALVRGLPHDEVLAAALEGTEASARAAGRIVRRITEKRALLRLHKYRERLTELVREAARLALADGERPLVDLTLRIPIEADAVMVDRIQIQQVIIQLMRNAAASMAEVSGPRRLTVEARMDAKDRVEVRVIDRGRAPPDEIRRQLEASVAGSATAADGIGLSVCRAIIEAHGGRIWVMPTAEGGTSIVFTLESGAPDSDRLHALAA